MKCDFCNNDFSSNSSLKYHQSTAKYCIKIQGKETDTFKCKYCQKKLSTKQNLDIHINTCVKHNESTYRKQWCEEKNLLVKDYEQQLKSNTDKISFLQEELKKKDDTIHDLQKQMQEVAMKAVSHNFEDKTTIEIDDSLCDNQFNVYESDESDNEENNYQLTPLELGQGYTIEHREEDGYINVTNLCKAGGKQFKAWFRLDKTKAFLQVLSSSVLINTDELIKYKPGSNNERSTWTHPQVAINIAQWISPKFDVKVSGWVYEIMMTGKVDITNTKTYKQLQQENKDKELKIQYLTKKYVKAQPRVQYEERNVIYILTTQRMKKDRVYILGKAINLTSRLSTYNKSDEHEVIFYSSCGDEETMDLIEVMVFKHLKDHREQANRERFILPKNEDICLFSNAINKSIEFFKK